MGLKRNYNMLIFVIFMFVINSWVESTEFVPVYAWSSQKITEEIPALARVSEDSFKDDILDRLKSNPFIIVFVEETLSPEDFSDRDQSGELMFPNLFKLRSSSKSTYLPYVQNPLKALRNLNKEVKEISIDQYILLSKETLQSDIILFVDLNDAHDQEERSSMLRRHDAVIGKIYENALKYHDNVLAIYTSKHISWAGPENVDSRKTRSLLQAAPENTTFYGGDCILLYISGKSTYTEKDVTKDVTLNNWSASCAENNITLSGTDETANVKFEITFEKTMSQYWQLVLLVVTSGSEETINISKADTMYAPVGFSYHCGDQIFRNKDKTVSLAIPNFQIQPFVPEKTEKFSDAYDCVGFTTVPIWSGLFVTSILLLIMTFGLTMMIDIKTMDRFDDAKGKTITINASE